MPTLAELNQVYREFWSVQSKITLRRLDDPVLREAAMERMRLEHLRRMPLCYRVSLDSILEEYDRLINRARSEQGRKGGREKRRGALQELINDIVRRRPQITAPELLEALRREQGNGMIDDIDDGSISFHDASGLKTMRVKSLKHRLTRARKILRS